MRVFKRRGFSVAVFNGDDDLQELHRMQDNAVITSGEKKLFIYVPVDGTDDIYLYPDRFLVKNRNASLMNHFLWEGLFTKEKQDQELMRMVDEFIDTDKQFLIEEYNFVADEPFYDYSGGRDE